MTGGLAKAARMFDDAISRNDTAFDTRIADGTTNRIDASGEYPFNLGRHRFLENGTFTHDLADLTDPGAFNDLDAKAQVTAQPGDEHIFGARELVRYVPNYELLWGIAAWAETELTPGQHFTTEFSEAAGDNGYRVHYEGTPAGEPVSVTLEQFQGSTTPVDTYAVDVADASDHGFDHTKPHLNRGFINWYGVGLWRHQMSYPVRDAGGDIARQENRTVGRTANDDDVATDRINLRIQARVWADAGADPVTVNVCSLGALIRGSATQRNREKPAGFWDIGGAISQYPTDNVDSAFAARVDPDRREVSIQAEPPLFEPAGSGVVMELGVYAVHKDHPDLGVNFDDPDDDGTEEGATPAAQSRAQTDVMQYTRAVTSVPTATDIRADGTEGLVPDMRQLTTTFGASGGGNSPGSTSAGEGATIKRNVYPDDVVIFLPRTDPAGSTTNGRIRYLKPLWEQDW